jgi:hypothetical protein
MQHRMGDNDTMLTSTEPRFHEGDADHDPVAEYWTAIETIVEWAGEQHLVVQLPLPFATAA